MYTAGIWEEIAPQDDYKSPIDIKNVEAGRTSKANPVGYNVTYLYPHNGLGDLFRILANHCSIKYEKRVVSIDIRNKKLEFSDGSKEIYDRLMATLPLNQLLEFSNLKTKSKNDPYTSVLVFNIGAVKGKNCPKEHWLYIPESRAGFHRVGFYSNVDSSFLPKSARADSSLVSIYVEKAYKGGLKPTEEEIQRLCKEVVQELQQWQFINEDEIVDPTWVEVAYTWAYPQSRWRQEAMSLLQEQDIFPVGRYARWIFQGIADSIRDGFIVGSSFKSST